MPDLIKDSYLGVIQYSEEDKLYQGKISDVNNQNIEFCLLDLDVEKNI